MKRPYRGKPRKQLEAGRIQIEELIGRAGSVFKDDKKLANRYIEMARKIGMRLRIRIKPSLQRRFCKHCYKYLMPGVNCRVRTHLGKVVYYCKECKKYMRFAYKKKKNKEGKKWL